MRRLVSIVALVLTSACGGETSGALDAGLDGGAAVLDAGLDGNTVGMDASRDAGAGRALRILFIGNSYTYVNDLPVLVRDALASAPEIASIEVESVTVGGATLADHWLTGTAAARIRAGGFTHVVLQGQSTEPVYGPSNFLDYAVRFATAVREAGAIPVFYETWARRAGDPIYSDGLVTSPADMQATLDVFYEEAAGMGMGWLAPVGDAWLASLAARPTLGLYMDDGSHPSLAGSWLAASVFVCTIAHRSALGLPAPSGVSAADATFLAGVADDACAVVAMGAADAGVIVPDAGPIDAGVDAGLDGGTSAGCAVGSAIFDPGTMCDGRGRIFCMNWATSSGVAGAIAECAGNRCQRADACGATECTCGGGPECTDDQMCANDGAGGPYRCVCLTPV